MEVALERLPNSVAKVSVTIDPADVSAAMDKAFRSVASRYNIPGFRRGKVPRPIFERMVGRDVLLQEAAQKIVEMRYVEALKEAAIEPVAEPRINIVTLVDGSPFEFAIEVESKPEITLGDYTDLIAEPLEIREVTDEDIEAELTTLARGQAQMVPADEEPVAMGNHITVKLQGYLEGDESGEPFVDDDAYAIEVGSGSVVEGLEPQLIGLMVAQPQSIRLTYPEEHPDVSLAGKDVRFEIEVTENRRAEVPPIDDDLAKALGLESLQELREHVANTVKSRIESQAKSDRLAEILGKLKERVTLELPAALVAEAVQGLLHELQNSLMRMGATLDEYLESRQIQLPELQAELRPQAEERVKQQLLLEAVAKENNLTVTDEEVIESIRPLAEMYQQPVTKLIQLFKARGEFSALRDNMVLSKASDYLTGVKPEAADPA